MNNLKSIYDKYDTIICLDTETTGLNPQTDQIIDLGVIAVERIRDELFIRDEINALIKLQDKTAKLSPEIVELTHITDEMLQTKGYTFEEIRDQFKEMLNKPGKKLIATYNAQFDLSFLRYFLRGCKFEDLAFLDILTVYKDRALYPHKLYQAVTHYNLDDKVQNTHRALDDTLACFEVLKSMSEEKDDIDKYVNLFGYTPKFGEPKLKIKGITYKPQPYVDKLGKPLYE
jgi:DNA polymerase-3 subunit epsilon